MALAFCYQSTDMDLNFTLEPSRSFKGYLTLSRTKGICDIIINVYQSLAERSYRMSHDFVLKGVERPDGVFYVFLLDLTSYVLSLFYTFITF